MYHIIIPVARSDLFVQGRPFASTSQTQLPPTTKQYNVNKYKIVELPITSIAQ